MYKYSRIALFLLAIFARWQTTQAQSIPPVFQNPRSIAWADSVFNSLTYEQKIGQLFMVDAYSNRDSVQVNFISGLVKDYHIGGVIFFQGGPVRQANLTNYYQSLSSVPLFVGIDGEWGLSMRLDSTIRFPRQMTLGAGGNDSMIYRMASEIGRECRRMGIHLNFAPVADINNNPLNPVINSRSFGEDKYKVTSGSLMYLKGLQEHNVLACGKHFPGHGNTDSDSHFTLPVINQSLSEMDSVELYPFRELIKNGIASMMVAHLFIPAFDTSANLASTLSSKIINDLLKKQMGFDGLIFTDALNMKGVADHYPSGELELKALLAGNDVLLYSLDVPAAWQRIHFAIQNCEIDQEEIDSKVKRILMAKHWAGLNKTALVDTSDLIADLNTPDAIYLTRKLYENAITVLANNDQLLPLKNIGPSKIASIVINDTINNPFQEMLSNYCSPFVMNMEKDPTVQKLDSIAALLSTYEYVIFSIHNTSTKAVSGYGISDKTAELLKRLQGKVKLITVVFGNAYTLTRLPGIEKNGSLIISYEDTWWPQYYTAQAIFGAAPTNGKLPVTPGNGMTAGTGNLINKNYSRLRYTVPEEIGLAESDFSQLDTLAMRAIANGATPGCQVLVALKGKVIYQKSFGKFTYEDSVKYVKNTDLYDIASVTKIAATALAVMKLYEDGAIDIDKKASKYLHELRKTNKKDLIISDILTHQAGLKSWVPFWKETMDDSLPSYNIYHKEKDVNYSVQVADSLFILNSYPEKIWKEIIETPSGDVGKMEYSDLGMIIMQKLIEKVTDKPLDVYLEEQFYGPLGLHRLLYNPDGKISLINIVPTENDTAFRQRLIRGYVHDPAAAMMGGVAGHAGLFSDAGSLAVIMQMLLNGGEYGGKKYLERKTVELFTSRYNKSSVNRRGLVFDKPDPLVRDKNGPTAVSASLKSFGHSGFTGTCAWADPDKGLVYIFLSNRVYPSASNNKLAKGNYRTDIMEAVYDVLRKNGK